jgi:hypothetical protein
MDPLVAAACASLLTAPVGAPGMLSPKVEDPALCVLFDLDAAGRFAGTLPAVGIARGFQLPRAHFWLGLNLGEVVDVRMQFAAVRSGGNTGYIGVDGEAIVPRFNVAEARFTWRQGGLGVYGGLIEDAWVKDSNAAWSYRPIAATFGEEADWFDRSDIGVGVEWSAPRRIAGVNVTLTTGEGLRFRERNTGWNTTATATFRPLAIADAGMGQLLEVGILARDGSKGLGVARDHRAGFRVGGHLPYVDVQVEGLAAFGVGGDGERTPQALSVYAGIRDLSIARGFLRADLVREQPGNDDANWLRLRAGGGVALPPWKWQKPFEILLGYELLQAGPDATSLAGAAALQTGHTFFVQIGARIRGAGRLADLPPLPPLPKPGAAGTETPQ